MVSTFVRKRFRQTVIKDYTQAFTLRALAIVQALKQCQQMFVPKPCPLLAYRLLLSHYAPCLSARE